MADNKIHGYPDDGQRAIMQAMQDYFYSMYPMNAGMPMISSELRELSDESFLQFCGQMIAHISDAYRVRMSNVHYEFYYGMMEDLSRMMMRHAQGRKSETYQQFAKSWHQVITGQTHDISTLWDGFDANPPDED